MSGPWTAAQSLSHASAVSRTTTLLPLRLSGIFDSIDAADADGRRCLQVSGGLRREFVLFSVIFTITTATTLARSFRAGERHQTVSAGCRRSTCPYMPTLSISSASSAKNLSRFKTHLNSLWSKFYPILPFVSGSACTISLPPSNLDWSSHRVLQVPWPNCYWLACLLAEFLIMM